MLKHHLMLEVLHKLNESRDWTGLYIADSYCFHYHIQSMLRMLEASLHTLAPIASSGYSVELHRVWKRDERVISQAIDLNEQLRQVLERHDVLITAGRSTSTLNHFVVEEAEEEEETNSFFRRIRKGKACVHPEDEEHKTERPLSLLDSLNPGERLHRQRI